MSAVDKQKFIGRVTPPQTSDGTFAFVTGDNNKRTERYNLVVTGQVDITVAGAGLRNRGSILAALTNVVFSDGGTEKYSVDARLARFIAEAMAPSALPATRLTGAGVQAATLLRESLPVWLSAARTINLNDTKWVETNKQLQQNIGAFPLRLISRLVSGAPTGTITNLAISVEQLYDDLVTAPPWLSPFVRQVVQDVTGVNASLRVDLRGSRAIRGIAIQQDTDQGEVSDIITGLVLRGDSRSIIGDQAVPFQDLVDHQADEYGGALPPGYLFIDFARYGRLSTLYNPYQDTNLRLELAVAPSGGGATGSKVRVAIWEYERTSATAAKIPVMI